MAQRLSEKQWEDLNAFLDGELSEQRAEEIRARIDQEEQWGRAMKQIRKVDQALDVWSAPKGDAELASRILDRTRSEKTRSRNFWRYIGGGALAAAAAIALLALIYFPASGTHTASKPIAENDSETPVEKKATPTQIAESDKTVVENLDFFRNYEVVKNYETLRAIERLEKRSEQGT